jgi:tol-pal system protein YbgF
MKKQNKVSLGILAVAMAIAVVTPADAANKEHQQLMADLRMLQEQSQQLQNLIGTVTETLKGLNGKMDQQAEATRKSFADQKLTVDNLSNDVRTVREKLDDNNVRISKLGEELDALRQSMQQMSAVRSANAPAPGSDTAAAAGSAAGGPAAPPVPVGTSPTKLFDAAWSDYTSSQYDLAIIGFDTFIRTFPTSEMANYAQVLIGSSYLQDGKYDKAVEAYDKAIRNYPTGDRIPDAYYGKGVALQSLKQPDRAREAWDYVVKNFPTSDAGLLAKQKIDQLKR